MLPFNQNINLVQLVAAIAMLLTMFGIELDPKTQAAIVSVIIGVNAIVTWLLHTFVNHPANKAAAEALVNKAVSGLRNSAPMLLAALLLSLTLIGCTTSGGMTPQDDLNAVSAAFGIAEAGYDAICAANQPPSFCTDPAQAADYAKAKLAVTAAIATAQAAISASGNLDSAAIEALLNSLRGDYDAYNAIVNTTEAKAAALR